MPPKANHRGPTYSPKTEAGALDPHGSLAEVDFLSGFRAPRDGSEPRGRHQGSAERTREPRDKSGPMERIRAPQYKSGPRGTDQDPQRRIRTPNVESGAAGRIRAPRNRSGPRETDEGPQDEVYGPAE